MIALLVFKSGTKVHGLLFWGPDSGLVATLTIKDGRRDNKRGFFSFEKDRFFFPFPSTCPIDMVEKLNIFNQL